jgi:DNA-binding CsgD family transcriptional regulator
LNRTPLDDRDFRILTIVADSGKTISSWEICQKLFPSEKGVQNHLSSVIWRLDKLTKVQALTKLPHPRRRKKVVYCSSKAPISIDGTVFIPSKLGEVIVSCKFAGNCHPCRLDSPKCRLSEILHNKGNHELVQAFYSQDGDGNGSL